jgi:hypothetical protein
MVELSAPGRDLIRAILYKWLCECDDAQAKAKEWAEMMPVGRYAGQVTYWKNAASFIVGKLCNNLPLRFNAGKFLPLIAKWPAGTMAPERWASELFYALAQAVPDEPTELTTGGGGTDGDGVHRVPPVAADESGPVGEAVTDGPGPYQDPATTGTPDGGDVGGGTAEPRPTDRRGRSRKPTGPPNGNAGAEPAATRRGSATSRSGKPGRK